MIVSHRYRFVFLKTKKTAGTSIEVLLSQYCDESDIVTKVFPAEENHKPRNWKGRGNLISDLNNLPPRWQRSLCRRWLSGEKYFNHMPADLVRHRVGEDIWQNYFKFTVERHPLEKTKSHFLMQRARSGNRLTLEEYFRRGRFCTNFPIYTDIDKNIAVDKILSFERLNADLQETLLQLGIEEPQLELPRAKTSYCKNAEHAPIQFSDAQLNELSKAFGWEIDQFGYELWEQTGA